MKHASGMQEAAVTTHDPFAQGAVLRVVPTTEPQREVWLADRLGEDASLAFNEACTLRLHGALEPIALQAALQALVHRHDALRSSIGGDGETMCIGAPFALPLPLHDLSGQHNEHSETARQARIAALLESSVTEPFALDHGPLFRAALLRLSADEHLLLLCAHHIVCDGWSWWLMVRELGDLYAAAIARAGAQSPAPRGSVQPVADAVGPAQASADAPIDAHAAAALAASLVDALPAPMGFADYALAQARRGRDAQARADEAYWVGRFADGVPTLNLPLDHPRPPRRAFASRREDVVLDAALLGAVRRLGAQRGASLFATLLGGFATLLSRLTGQASVVVGIPAAGQSVDDNDGVVGHCVNLLPLRFDIDPTATVSALIGTAQETLLDGIDHQRMTFGTLLRHLQVERDPSRLPLVSVMFNIDQALERDAKRFPGLSVDFASVPRTHENFELFVNAVQRDGALVLECQYATALFDAATIRRWMRAFAELLRQAAQAPQAALGQLPMLDADDRAALAALQPARSAYDRGCAMHQGVERQCDRAPERIAVRHGQLQWSYAQLDERANRIAALLRGHGVHAGSLVGLALERGPDMLAALLGILKAGAGYVPLDPGFPRERLAYMLGDAGLAALVTQRALAAQFDLRGRPVLVLDDAEDALAAASSARVQQRIDPESVAYVIYTSGSTGKPKGVQVPHGAVANFLTSMQQRPGLSCDDVLVAVTTLSFDIAVLELLLPLWTGAQVVIADRSTAIDGAALSALLAECGATLMQATPATWRLLLEADWRGTPGFRALCGGEPLPPDLARALLARSDALWNLYGPTETTVWSTCCRVDAPERGIHIGTPIANTRVWVLDAQGQPCPLGVPGELCIGGDGVTLGYLGRDALTAETFVPDPFAGPGDAPQHAAPRLYRTGDRARWRADGVLEHLGRLDFQVKVRGYRIELGDIEAALAQLPGVAQAVAIVREDRPGDVRIAGYVVARAEGTDARALLLDERAAVTALAATLPDYMLPQHITSLDALPLLPNGKLNRAALPAPGVDTVARAITAPRNATERAIAAAMMQVLGLAEVDIHDNFFALGGHSLLAAQLVSRVNRDVGLRLSLRALFEGPTVARLAALAGDAGSDAAPVLAPKIPRLSDRTRAPLSLMQERLWMLAQLSPNQLTYNTPSAHRLSGALDVARFVQAFDIVAARQPVLRTSIAEVDGVAMQVIHDTLDSGLAVVTDLTALPEHAREAHALADIDALVHTPLQMSAAPMFVARLYRIAPLEHIFFFMPHHAIWDGWSFDLLYAELSQAYAALERGEAPALPRLMVSYGDYAAWHRGWVDGPEYAEQLAFWRRHHELREGMQLRALPTDEPRRPGMSGKAGVIAVDVSEQLVTRLHTVARAHDATLFITLLAAYYALIATVGGLRKIVIGTPVRNRNSDETEPLMGYFTNLLPLRVAVDAEQPFAALMAAVRDAVVDGFAHPDVRLEDLLSELNLRGDGGGVLYHTLFSYQDIRQRVLRWGSVQHERLETATPGATQDLGIWFIESEEGLRGAMNYNSSLFRRDTAELVWARYMHVLEAVAADAEQTVGGLMAFDDGQPTLIGRRHTAQTGSTGAAPQVASGTGTVPARALSADGTTQTPARRDAAGAATVRRDAREAQAAATRSADSAADGAADHQADAQQQALLRLIAAHCGAVLGEAEVQPDDDFFGLGGNSLQAVQLFHRLARATGVNLPLATLLSASTMRGLADAFAAAGARVEAVAHAPSGVHAQATVSTSVPVAMQPVVGAGWRPLVPMRAGSGTPLFFVHAVGGNVLNYRPLAMQMPAEVPVYGLQAYGLDGRTAPLTRVEDMARAYIAEMRSVQPHGPYQLAGGSMGGMIAYEIARQLHAQGERVSLLGLIDTSATYAQRLRTCAAQSSAWQRLLARVRGVGWRHGLSQLVRSAGERMRKSRALRAAARARAFGNEVPHAVRPIEVEVAHFAAYRDYVVQPYAGALTLFRADQQRNGSAVDASLGWDGMVGTLRVISVPGDHYNVVEAPELGAALRDCVASAQAVPVVQDAPAAAAADAGAVPPVEAHAAATRGRSSAPEAASQSHAGDAPTSAHAQTSHEVSPGAAVGA